MTGDNAIRVMSALCTASLVATAFYIARQAGLF